MFADLSAALSTVLPAADATAYERAIIDDNCTGKSTTATRRATQQRLSELYGLDPDDLIFRALRHLWDRDVLGRPLMAVTCALARDPRLRQTAPFILDLRPDAELQREVMKDAVRSEAHNRLSEATLDKVVRNASSTWVQSGHLNGRTFKRRAHVVATPAAATYAAYVAYLAGHRGMDMFASDWFRVLDLRPEQALDMLQEARRLDMVDLRIAGEVVSIRFDRLAADPRRA